MQLKNNNLKLSFKSLENTPIIKIVSAFNQSFKDYILPLQLTEDDFKAKVKAENILLKYSVGTFVANELIGFILIGVDAINNTKIAYNAGTGVISSYRGNNLTARMYQYILPVLATQNIKNHQLEVITQNLFALQAYQKIGFQIQRNFSCYKGYLIEFRTNKDIKVKEITFNDLNNIEYYTDQIPSYQNSLNTIQRTLGLHSFYGAFVEDKLVGFLFYSHSNFRVKLFGVHKEYRKKGIATALFMKLKLLTKEKQISIINIEETNKSTLLFIKKIGLSKYIQQYEMSCTYEN